jgi:hypothetical protein
MRRLKGSLAAAIRSVPGASLMLESKREARLRTVKIKSIETNNHTASFCSLPCLLGTWSPLSFVLAFLPHPYPSTGSSVVVVVIVGSAFLHTTACNHPTVVE